MGMGRTRSSGRGARKAGGASAGGDARRGGADSGILAGIPMISAILGLSSKGNRRSNKRMSYENPFSHIQSLKGIAVDLPFLRFRYVTLGGGGGACPASAGDARAAEFSRVTAGSHEAPVRRILYDPPAKVTTLGVDPLVSSASVIHELSFGRIALSPEIHATGGYPSPKQEIAHSLDLFV